MSSTVPRWHTRSQVDPTTTVTFANLLGVYLIMVGCVGLALLLMLLPRLSAGCDPDIEVRACAESGRRETARWTALLLMEASHLLPWPSIGNVLKRHPFSGLIAAPATACFHLARLTRSLNALILLRAYVAYVRVQGGTSADDRDKSFISRTLSRVSRAMSMSNGGAKAAAAQQQPGGSRVGSGKVVSATNARAAAGLQTEVIMRARDGGSGGFCVRFGYPLIGQLLLPVLS